MILDIVWMQIKQKIRGKKRLFGGGNHSRLNPVELIQLRHIIHIRVTLYKQTRYCIQLYNMIALAYPI